MKTKLSRIFVYVVAAIALSSCYPIKRVGLIQERDALPDYEKGVYQQYKLQANDEIVVRVVSSNIETVQLFSNSNNANVSYQSYSYRIYEDGTVDIPFLAKVPVAGLTLNEAEAVMDTLLKEYVPDAFVKLALTTGTFCVIGDAGRGYFPIYKERMTIYQALALSGGINETADFSKVKILRRVNGKTEIKEFDIRTKSIIDSEYYYIYPNDVIYLDVSKRRFWGVSSYAAFIGMVSSALSLFVSVWNVFKE